MKTIDLTADCPSLTEILRMAESEPVVVKTSQGESFVISAGDEFTTEVELLRRNNEFLAMLDEFKREEASTPLEQIERELR